MKVVRQIAAHLFSKGLLTSQDRAFLLALGYQEFEYPCNDDEYPTSEGMVEDEGMIEDEYQGTETVLALDRKGNKRKGKKRRLLRRWWEKKVA